MFKAYVRGGNLVSEFQSEVGKVFVLCVLCKYFETARSGTLPADTDEGSCRGLGFQSPRRDIQGGSANKRYNLQKLKIVVPSTKIVGPFWTEILTRIYKRAAFYDFRTSRETTQRANYENRQIASTKIVVSCLRAQSSQHETTIFVLLGTTIFVL